MATVTTVRAKWEVLTDHLSAVPIDHLVTRDYLCDLLSVKDNRLSSVMSKARLALLAEHDRYPESVRGARAYRIIRAIEHEPIVRRRLRRANREATVAVMAATYVRRDELTMDAQGRIDHAREIATFLVTHADAASRRAAALWGDP